MGSTKSVLSNIGEALGSKAAEFTFLNPPLIEAPFTTITDLSGNPRKLPDPSRTLKPVMGIERIQVRHAIVSTKEKGPNGETDKLWLIASKKNEDTTSLETDAETLRDLPELAQTELALLETVEDIKAYDCFTGLVLSGSYE